jgi:hypothetical protein
MVRQVELREIHVFLTLADREPNDTKDRRAARSRATALDRMKAPISPSGGLS